MKIAYSPSKSLCFNLPHWAKRAKRCVCML